MATEAIGIAYGFFSPLEGFMKKADVESTCKKMELTDGTIWSIPIVFDISDAEIAEYGLKEGDTVCLTYDGNPLAIFEIEEIYAYDKESLAQDVYGTKEDKHPGVKRTYSYKDKFLGGKITLVHEWLMKHAYIAAHGDSPVEQMETMGQAISGILVNCIVGEKRVGDYIDEAIVLTQDELRKAGYFRDDIHMVTMTFWDMRYAAHLRAGMGLLPPLRRGHLHRSVRPLE